MPTALPNRLALTVAAAAVIAVAASGSPAVAGAGSEPTVRAAIGPPGPRPAFAVTEIPALLLPADEAAIALPAAPSHAALAARARLAALPPWAALPAASNHEAAGVAAIGEWNRAGRFPTRNGFARPLPEPLRVHLPGPAERVAGAHHGGWLSIEAGAGARWDGAVEVDGAWRLRLHLAGVRWPAGTRVTVAAADGSEEVTVDGELAMRHGELWTPSVRGPRVHLTVSVAPGRDAAWFTVDQVLEELALGPGGEPLPAGADEGAAGSASEAASCLVDAACAAPVVPDHEVHRRAVARLSFVFDGAAWSCTGALLNDTDPATAVPWLLSAHHCLRSQEVVDTLEAFFDHAAPTCGGAAPPLETLPRTFGGTLVASGPGTDVALVRLPSLPPGRGLLGSTAEPVAPGTLLHRLSHPGGEPLRWSATRAVAAGPTCHAWRRPQFLYSERVAGAIASGSSGAPVVRESDGRVVGQALAFCGPGAPGDPCGSAKQAVDGALAESWPTLAPLLAPAPAGCLPGTGALCLGPGGRFRVEASWRSGDSAGRGQGVALTAGTGYLWFFSPTNVELVVKTLDACAANGHFWVFAGGLTNVAVNLVVTDTATGAVRRYETRGGRPFGPVQDTAAFACN